MNQREYMGATYTQCQCYDCGSKDHELYKLDGDEDCFCEPCIMKLIEELGDEDDFLNLEYASTRF